MFRRSRFSARPNVGTAGKAAASSQDPPPASQEAAETPKEDVCESGNATAGTENKPVVTPSEKNTGPGEDQNGEGTSSAAAVQRRKRFSIKPKVAPGRISALSRTPKSPAKAASETPVQVPDLDNKPTTSGPSGSTEPSGETRIQPEPPLTSSEGCVHIAEDPSQGGTPPDNEPLESTPASQVKEAPSKPADKFPPSIPDRASIELSEKARTLMSSKSVSPLSAPAFTLSRLLNDPSDLQRLDKARKLREMLRQEMHKEKNSKRIKVRTKEYTLDPAIMTMRDLIRYLPQSNPMTTSVEESAEEKDKFTPPSPVREGTPERAQTPEAAPKVATPDEEDEDEEADEEQDDSLMVPRVKVAEDGTLIIDEESLTVEVQRAKGPNLAQERDPIFERGSTTTYSSFRKGTHTKPWSSEETDMYFLAISMVGTDFSMICQLFPHRARSEIKNKFKKEEKQNAWRIDKAFRDRRKLDIEYFSKLLEKILEVQRNRKKIKSLAGKPKKQKKEKKSRGKKVVKTPSDVEESEEEDDMPDLEGTDGEKENQKLCNDGEKPAPKPKTKRKRKEDAATEEPTDKKTKTGRESNEQDEADVPEDAEAALPEDPTKLDISGENKDMIKFKDTAAVKPARLFRVPKPLPLPLDRKWGEKARPKAKDDSPDKEEVKKDPSTTQQSSDDDDSSEEDEEEEEATVQPPRPTRYGRVPKPTKSLNYPAKKDAHSSESETSPGSPAGSAGSAAKPKPKGTAKRGRSSKLQSAETKKPKLVTLCASQSDYSDEEIENQPEDEELEENACNYSQDSIAGAFVPASLRSPHPMISEVEETMEELDILANMPDVLGMSQDSLCLEACEQAHNETGTPEPCEHQLDLLVDVIDFLSSEHSEVSEDTSYNEAAHTLLTIGNMAHLSTSATQDQTTDTTTSGVNETSQHLEENTATQEELSVNPLIYAISSDVVAETVATSEPQTCTADIVDVSDIKTVDQRTGSDMDSVTLEHSTPERKMGDSPQIRRGRLSKVKPKPNIGRASRTAQSKSQPENLTVRTDVERHTVDPNLSQSTEMSSAADLLNDDISSIEVKPKEEPPSSQEMSVEQEKSEHCLSDAKFEPSLGSDARDSTSEFTDEMQIDNVWTMESSSTNLLTSDSALPQSQVELESAPVQECTDHPSPYVTSVGELPVSQKEESKEASNCQTRRSRFQKGKPKPNLVQQARTLHSKPQTSIDTVEKDSNPTPNPESNEKRVPEVEAEPSCSTSPEKPSDRTKPLDFIPSLDSGSTLTPTTELSTTVEKTTDIVGGQVESGAATSDLSALENLEISEVQFEPSKEQASEETKPISESTGEKLISHDVTTEINPLISDSAEPESQVEQRLNIDTAPVQDGSDTLAKCPPQTEEIHFIEKAQSGDTSTCHTHKPIEELPSTDEKMTDVGQESSSEASQKSVPQRMRRFPKVKPKPNLGSPSRLTRTKPTSKDIGKPLEQPHMDTSKVTSEQQPVESNSAQTKLNLAVKDMVRLTSKDCSVHIERLSPIKFGSTESEKSLDGSNDKGVSSQSTVNELSLVAENQSMFEVQVAESKSSEETTVEGESMVDKTSMTDMVEAGPSQQSECKQDTSITFTSTNTQPADDITAISDVLSPEDCMRDSNIESMLQTNTQSTPDPKESTQQPCSKSESEGDCQDAVQQPPETAQTNPLAGQSTDTDQLEPVDSAKSSRKAPQRRRGRLVKPKLNLGRSSQPKQPTQVSKDAKQAETEGVDTVVPHPTESESQHGAQEPTEGALEHHTKVTSPIHDAGPSLGCLTQVPDNSSQQVSTLSTGGTQHDPSLTIFPQMLSEPMTSDLDEPFFILSLTAIPDYPSAELGNTAPEPLPCPLTDASIQQPSSVSGHSLTAVEDDGPLNSVAVPESMDVGTETGPIPVKDIKPDPAGPITLNPVDPHEGTSVQPSTLQDSNEETEIPPTKGKPKAAGRRAKQQAKPNPPRRNQPGRTVNAATGVPAESSPVQTDTTQLSELPGSPVQPKASSQGKKDPKDSSSGAPTTRITRTRKPKGSTSCLPETTTTAPSSSPPPGKAASRGSKVKTREAATQSTRYAQEPKASTSYVTLTPGTNTASSSFDQTFQHSLDSTFSTYQHTAQVSDSYSIDLENSSVEEEPTNVSQYFLSDIFTEVEEEG